MVSRVSGWGLAAFLVTAATASRADDIDINDPCWPEANALNHISEYTSGTLTREQAVANLNSCRRRQEQADRQAAERRAAEAKQKEADRIRQEELSRKRQAEQWTREHDREEKEAAEEARRDAERAAAEEEVARVVAMEKDKNTMRTALSAYVCAARQYRAGALSEIREQQRYARIGGGVIDLAEMKALQDQMRVSDAAIQAGRIALRDLGRHPAGCAIRSVAKLIECFGQNGEPTCSTEEVAAAMALVRDTGFASYSGPIIVQPADDDRIHVNTRRALEDALQKPPEQPRR